METKEIYNEQNEATRKRLFELLKSYFKVSLVLEDDEYQELASLFTEKNPYQEIGVQFSLDEAPEGDLSRAAGYYSGGFNITLTDKGLYCSETLCSLLDTIGHEYRHSLQLCDGDDEHSIPEEVVDAYTDRNISKEEIEEFYCYIKDQNSTPLKRFLNKAGKILQKHKIKAVQYGGYLSQLHEIDARKAGKEFAFKMINCLINDPLCPNRVKRQLKADLNLYKLDRSVFESLYNKRINQFKHFKENFKQAVSTALKKNPQEINEDEEYLLAKGIKFLTKEMSIDEKLDYCGWAIINNKDTLAHRINLINSKVSEKDKQMCIDYFDAMDNHNQLTYKTAKTYIDKRIDITSDKEEWKKDITTFICGQIQQGKIAIAYSEIDRIIYGRRNSNILDHMQILNSVQSYIERVITDVKSDKKVIFDYNSNNDLWMKYFCLAKTKFSQLDGIEQQVLDKLDSIYNLLHEDFWVNGRLQYSMKEEDVLVLYGEKEFEERFGKEKLESLKQKQDEEINTL